MSDPDLFALGCGVMFIAIAGAYAFLRERFLEGTRRAAVEIEDDRRHERARLASDRRAG